jgi:uncharacterized protein DUF3999
MKRLRSFIFLIVAATAVAAQTSVSQWPYYVEVAPSKNSTGMYEALIPLPVLDKARTDLADLRLYDSSNREIPYAIRVLKEVDENKEMTARIFNSATAGSASEVSVDLGESHGEHNEIEIDTDGNNFRRQVVVEGSDSGREWRTLNNDGIIFSFISQNSSAESGRVTYPTSRYRYLRVRVMRDPLADQDVPRVSNVKVMMAVREKGLRSTWEVNVPSYQLLRNQGAYASAWILDLGGRAPRDRITLYINEDSFSRPFQVESIDDPENVRLLATGTLTRHAGEEQKPLEITFNQEENVRKLRLQITDYSNPTLNIAAIQASAPGRQLVFELKEPPSQPLRLYFGNANVTAPHYDFEKEYPLRVSGEPIHASIGEVANNREYKPEPLPFTERVPWLIYLVLAASSIALGVILFSLARTATRMSTQQTN